MVVIILTPPKLPMPAGSVKVKKAITKSKPKVNFIRDNLGIFHHVVSLCGDVIQLPLRCVVTEVTLCNLDYDLK